MHSNAGCKVNLSIMFQPVIALSYSSIERRINMKDNRVRNEEDKMSNTKVNPEVNNKKGVVIDESINKSNVVPDDDFKYKGSNYNFKENHIEYDRERYLNDIALEKAGVNLSWRSIFAGLITFLALSILFSFISATIGLGVTDLTSPNPLDNVGIGLIIWTIISFIVSLGAGGYVAGLTANRAGAIHGFLTWALGLLAILYLATSTIGSAFNTLGSLMGVAGDTIADVANVSGDVVYNFSQEAFDSISDNLKIDTSELDKQVQDALKDSNIPELQPNYLQSQLDETVTDIQNAAKAVIVDGKDANEELNGVYQNIEERLTSIGESLDEEKLSNAISENTDLTDAEADKAVENIKTSYEEAQEQAKQLLADAETQLNQLMEDAEQTAEEVVETTNDVMNETSKYSFITFIGLTLAAILATFAGKKGAEAGSMVLDGATHVQEKV